MAPLLAAPYESCTFISSSSVHCSRSRTMQIIRISGMCSSNSVDRKQQIGIHSGSRRSLKTNLKCTRSAFTATAVPVRGVLFDMDGVLCDSEERSRDAAVEFFAELGVTVKPEDFIPFMGTGEANFLGGVAHSYGLQNFDPAAAKNRFFDIYIDKYAKPNSGLGFPGALELVMECKKSGLKLAVASSADRIKVNANLSAAGLPLENFDAIVSADVFERLKPAPDIFLAAAEALNLPPDECVVIEDALAGIQAAQAAGMRCIAVSTTLSEERLKQANPTLIRKNIGDIKLSDVLSLQGTDSSARESSSAVNWIQSMLDAEVALPVGVKTTRREAIRFGSLSVGVSCLAFVATHWKAMSYISPMAIVNDLLGVDMDPLPVATGTEIGSGNRLEMFKRYISDFEAKDGGPNVPEFPPGLKWLNTAAPLRFKGVLRGKLVILDFWTYCCINCMHILPDLAYLEEKYRDQPFTVVGVHSAKFDNEKDIDAIRNAVLRYNVTHPVVNDGDMNLWRQLGISSWPTLVVVSPKGKVLARLAGEGHREELKDLMDAAIQYYGEKKLLNIQPNIPELLEKDKDTRLLTAPLSFPGKITTDLANGRLFISDSNHHRIVITDLNGNFILQVGSGDDGLNDGSFELASFNRPQGVAYNARKNVLYVADTENHALREIDFVKEIVKTLAGTGEKGLDFKGGKTGQSQLLNSPWDLCLHPNGKLYIAMAGQHQIWEFDTVNNIAQVFSGDGYERNLNGSRGSNSSYAQPSGVALAPDMDHIYIADSESSSVRSVDLKTAGSRWLSGGDPSFPENLFQFGDKDGAASQALFQHPLGVAAGTNGLIYIADSYNHKIKVMNVSNQTVKTIAGTGVAGYEDGNGLKAQFSEPAGLAIGPNGGSLLVSDTNNNLIRVIEFQGDTVNVSTLQLKGIVSPEKTERKAPRRLRKRSSADMEIVRLQPVSALKGDFNVDITLPPGFHFSKEAKSKFDVDIEPDGSATVDPTTGTLKEGKAKIRFYRTRSTSSMLRIISKVYYCEEEVVCLYKGVVFEVPLEEGSEEEEDLALKYSVAPQKCAILYPKTKNPKFSMERDAAFLEIDHVPVSLIQVMEFLGSNPRFQQLPIATIEKLARAVQPRVFGPKEKLVNIPSGIYIVWNGELITGNPRNVLKRAEYGTHEEFQGAIASNKVTCLLLDPDHGCLIYNKNIWESSEVTSSAEKIMQLEIMGIDMYRGFSIPSLLTFRQMFGGQLVGQALAAASKSVNPFLLVHSLHSYFLRPGDTNVPVVYQVERVQDSRNFANRFVRAIQNNQIIFTMAASFQREENGVEHQISMPDVPQPEKLMPEESEYEKYLYSSHLSPSIKEAIMENLKKERPLDVRCCEYMDHTKPQPCDSRQMVWLRAKGDISRDQALHRCIAAYASDWIFLDCALKPHGWTCGPDSVYQITNNSNLNILSLDHTLWFHKSLKVDQWHLFSMESPRAASSRALVTGHIYSQSGELVISAAQEGLIRTRKLDSKL